VIVIVTTDIAHLHALAGLAKRMRRLWLSPFFSATGPGQSHSGAYHEEKSPPFAHISIADCNVVLLPARYAWGHAGSFSQPDYGWRRRRGLSHATGGYAHHPYPGSVCYELFGGCP
jgi:hypothetical protein